MPQLQSSLLVTVAISERAQHKSKARGRAGRTTAREIRGAAAACQHRPMCELLTDISERNSILI